SMLRRLGVRADIIGEQIDVGQYDVVFYPHTGKVMLKGKTVCDLSEIFAYPIFEKAGQLLNGHIDLEGIPDKLGGDVDFYLDWVAWRLREALSKSGLALTEYVSNPWGDHSNVLVLRHDTDSSVDTTYLEYELANSVPATYAILPENCGFWMNRLSPHLDLVEASWHWASIGGLPYITYNKPSKSKCSKDGVYKQAERGSKVITAMQTLHKHGNAFYYPEIIDAMDFTYNRHPELMGMGTMARWHMIRWDESWEHRREYTVQHPHVSVPFWMPYHLAISSVSEYRTLRGWDMSHFIEPSPDAIDRIFVNAKRLPGGVYMVGYHPAHAKSDTFNKGGNFPWYVTLVERARDEGWLIATYRDVLKRLNDCEAEK
ncbi:MAG: hypothetical protein PHQ43_04355, partial [Dehalococcoidales bacterium]|nr:hypothetical protein [Dehalococcoidales bacterium]